MFYKDKSVLVTGGTGFIGMHVVEELLHGGARVRISTHNRPLMIEDSRIEQVAADLTKPEDCLRVLEGIDYVFHTAGVVGSAGATSLGAMANISINLTLTAQVLLAAWRVGVKRLLLFSSSTVYPFLDYPVKEEEAWNGPTHQTYFGYGWMKRYLEKLAEYVSSESNTRIAILRPTAAYGRGDNFNLSECHVIPALIIRALKKENPFVVWGTGEEVRDFLHVSDLAKASLLFLERYPVCDPINIGYGKGITIKELVRIILNITRHTEAKIIFDSSKPTTIPFRMVDVSKAKCILNFEAKVSIEDGLADTVKWYKEYASGSYSKKF